MAIQLNEAQQAAARHVKGPAIVLAGPGSGKTRVLVHRAQFLIQNGLAPQKHLLVTFSRKAAEEMRSRLATSLGAKVADCIPITTFHAFGFRVIREHPNLFARKPNPTVLDEKEAVKLLQSAAKSVIEADTDHLKRLLETYSFYRNDGALLPVDGTDRTGASDRLLEQLRFSFCGLEKALACLEAYEQAKQRNNLLDFDDLIALPGRLLPRLDDLSKRYAVAYPFISVDESQDTNRVQFQIIEAIGRWHRNLFVVGDDDQLIYEWRGARMQNLHGFINRFAPKTYRLECNYRSTPTLVEAAVQHITHNTQRLEKRPYAANQKPGPAPSLLCFENNFQMAAALAKLVQKQHRAGVPLSQIAILYRINRLAYLLENELKRLRIPYQIVGGISFTDRKEIKAALAAVRLLKNPKDTLALETLAAYVPKLGKTGLAKIAKAVDDQDVGVFDASLKLPPQVAKCLAYLKRRLDLLQELGPGALGDWVMSREGLNLGAKTKDSESRKRQSRNLTLLQTMADDWDGYLALILDGDEFNEGNRERLTLSTIHRAKGKEWHTVFVPGFSEGILPSDRDDIEDARRVSYVAVTRAKQCLKLLHCDTIVWGKDYETYHEPSRFADELLSGIRMRKSAKQRLAV